MGSLFRPKVPNPPPPPVEESRALNKYKMDMWQIGEAVKKKKLKHIAEKLRIYTKIHVWAHTWRW